MDKPTNDGTEKYIIDKLHNAMVELNKDENENENIIENKTELVKKDIESINTNSLIFDTVLENKVILLSTIPLFVGYYLQDTVFTRSIAEVTSNIPEYFDNIDWRKILIVLLPYIISLILFYISNIISSKTSSKIEVDLINKLTDKLIESIRTSKKTFNVNDLILHVKKLAETKNIYNIFITYIVPTFIVAIGLIYNFILSDGTYTIYVILILIVMMLVTMKLEYDSIYNAQKTEESYNELYDEIHEIMINIDTVITSNTRENEMTNVGNVGTKTYELACISELNNSNTTYGLQTFSIVTMLGINYMSYSLYKDGRIDASVFTSTILLSLLFMDYYNYCIHAIAELISSMGKYNETKNYFEDFKIEITPPEIEKRLIELKIIKGDIVFKNINLKYDNKQVFKNLNLEIKGATTTGLVGPIGSGKTTMLKMLAGIIDYDGEILIDGQNLKECTYESIVDNIAYISQHPKLFNKSLYYNINYGSCYTEEEIYKKMKELGLMPFIQSFQNKLDTVAGKEGSKLSGGQKQFVALIRAIVQNKSIFLLDEPSSSLDETNKQIFIDLIKKIKNKTIIISTHDVEIMVLFDRVINVGNIANSTKKKSINEDNDNAVQAGRYEQRQYSIKMY
jgi:ABC-type multidrug transport system fused ATPase/permease subunit